MGTKEIETAVTEFLQSAGVTYSVQLVGAAKRDDWECDEWRVTLKSARADCTFPFFTGIGHRKPPHKPRSWDNVQNPRELVRWNKANAKPVAPHAASVLHSLVLDGQAIDQSFTDWCDEFGHSDDSRKALQTYEACCESGRKLRQLFTHAQREQLSQLLQDY